MSGVSYEDCGQQTTSAALRFFSRGHGSGSEEQEALLAALQSDSITTVTRTYSGARSLLRLGEDLARNRHYELNARIRSHDYKISLSEPAKHTQTLRLPATLNQDSHRLRDCRPVLPIS